MVISITHISSESRLDDYDCHFKVSAGPGAGKTRWLANHIKHVIHNSSRLGISRKIACITYTNVAAETIMERLGIHVDRIEISTIHSFLYKHLVKPYAFLIPPEYELNIEKLDGHDEIPVYPGILYEWKKQTSQMYLKDDDKVIEALKDLAWQFDKNDELCLAPKKIYLAKIGKFNIKKASYIEYKKMCWRNGWLEHDDVLYFSYILINRFERLLDVIRSKFPYFFIDEFQDTNPIQTYILKKIGESETVVGVIGDVAQSIYGFQGAKTDNFIEFSLPGLREYTILDNHRSSNNITNLLNSIRPDLNQCAKRNFSGTTPKILVGNKLWALDMSYKYVENGVVCTLSRDNITSNSVREKVLNNNSSVNLIEELIKIDSNPGRANLIISCIKAVEFGKRFRYKEALKGLCKELKKINNELDVQKEALRILKYLFSQYETFKEQSLMEFYSIVSQITPGKVSGFKGGKIKNFYMDNAYKIVALSVHNQEDSGLHRTIHKAKGAEFDNVLLILDTRGADGLFQEEKELEFLLNPNLLNKEEHRVRYVAISRARNNLFVNIPSISPVNEQKLKAMGFDIIKQEKDEN